MNHQMIESMEVKSGVLYITPMMGYTIYQAIEHILSEETKKTFKFADYDEIRLVFNKCELDVAYYDVDSSNGTTHFFSKKEILEQFWQAVADKSNDLSTGIEKEPESEDHGKHYRYSYKGIKLDPYRILKVYNIADPAQQHVIKKLLRAGDSVKDLVRDIDEVILSLNRWKEMIEEDSK